MKKILLITFLGGAVAAAAIILLTRKTPGEKAADDVSDAAEDAFDTMNKHLHKVENATEAATGIK